MLCIPKFFLKIRTQVSNIWKCSFQKYVIILAVRHTQGFPGGASGEVRDACSVPRLGRSPGGGNDNPLQCSCLENPKEAIGSQRTGHNWSDLASTTHAFFLFQFLTSLFFFLCNFPTQSLGCENTDLCVNAVVSHEI